MVMAVICMSPRRYVLKICVKVSEYTESLTYEGIGLKYYAIYCAAGCLIQPNCQAQYVPSCHTISRISHLCPFYSGFSS